jgi:hypothetical protein
VNGAHRQGWRSWLRDIARRLRDPGGCVPGMAKARPPAMELLRRLDRLNDQVSWWVRPICGNPHTLRVISPYPVGCRTADHPPHA